MVFDIGVHVPGAIGASARVLVDVARRRPHMTRAARPGTVLVPLGLRCRDQNYGAFYDMGTSITFWSIYF